MAIESIKSPLSTSSPLLLNIKDFRKSRKESQVVFWRHFGLTQPGGSRYENGHPIPRPTALLLDLFMSGEITEEQLKDSNEKLSLVSQVLPGE